MTTRGTVLTAVVVGTILTALFIIDNQRVSERAVAERREKLFEFDPELIYRVEIQRGSQKVILSQQNGRWMLLEPLIDRADLGVVRELIHLVANLRSRETLTPEAPPRGIKPADAGLANPRLRVSLVGFEGEHQLFIGKETAFEGRVYVRVGSDRLIDVVDASIRDLAAMGINDFRDKFLFTLTPEETVDISWEKGEAAVSLERAAQAWEIRRPERARADRRAAESLLNKLTSARNTGFLALDDAEKWAQQEPIGSITLRDEPGHESKLEIYWSDEKDAVGRMLDRDAFVAFDPALTSILSLSSRDFREQSLLRLHLDSVDRIRIQSKETTFLLKRDGDRWRFDSSPIHADPAQIQHLLKLLSTPGLAEFEADTLSSVADSGIDAPAASIKFMAYSSENTLHSKAGEQLLAEVRFGAETGDQRVYAASSLEPYLFSVPIETLDALPSSLSDWRDPLVLRGEPEDVRWVEEPQSGARIERDNNDRWRIRKGRGVLRETALESRARTLASLKAVQWVRPSAPELTPEVEFQFGWQPATSNTETVLSLHLWRRKEGWLGRLKGVAEAEEYFLLSQPQFELLAEPILQR